MSLNPTRRRALALAVGMGAAASAARLLKPRLMADLKPAVKLEAIFPRAFGQWKTDPVGELFVRPPDVQAAVYAAYAEVLERTYIDGQGRRVMLSVAYSTQQSTRDQMHRPEGCYAFRGFRVEGSRAAIVQLQDQALPVTRLYAEMSNRPEPITYWMVVGDEVVADPIALRNRVLSLGLKRLLPDGMLVRVSTIETNKEQGWQTQAEFIHDLAAAIPTALRQRALGSVGGPASRTASP